MFKADDKTYSGSLFRNYSYIKMSIRARAVKQVEAETTAIVKFGSECLAETKQQHLIEHIQQPLGAWAKKRTNVLEKELVQKNPYFNLFHRDINETIRRWQEWGEYKASE